MHTSDSKLPRWIVLANAYSVDAALVAVAWQGVFLADTDWGFIYGLVLGLTVWLAFTADHLLDVRGRREGGFTTLRHRLHARHYGRLVKLLRAVFVLDVLVAIPVLMDLPVANIAGSFCLALLAGVYLLGAQRFKRWPKAPLIGVLMAWGALAFGEHLPAEVFIHAGLFGVLCAANSKLVALSESGVRNPAKSRAFWLSCAACAAVLLAECVPFSAFDGSLAVRYSALLVCLAALGCPHLREEDFRVAADWALLIAPLSFLVIR